MAVILSAAKNLAWTILRCFTAFSMTCARCKKATKDCHSERSEESRMDDIEKLHCVQHDIVTVRVADH
jgi:hypothetical protein